jgi:hypothetical protein
MQLAGDACKTRIHLKGRISSVCVTSDVARSTASDRSAPAASGLGKQRIADELAKANGWVPIVNPNTVKRILHNNARS